MDYLTRIKNAQTRFEAADLVRAFGCQIVGKNRCYSSLERIVMIEEYERQAETLERDFNLDADSDEPCSEDDHPWRQWLKEWGFC